MVYVHGGYGLGECGVQYCRAMLGVFAGKSWVAVLICSLSFKECPPVFIAIIPPYHLLHMVLVHQRTIECDQDPPLYQQVSGVFLQVPFGQLFICCDDY